MYLVAVEGVGAEEGERDVAAEPDEGQERSAEGDARAEQVAVVVVVQQVVALRQQVGQREYNAVRH